MVTKKCGDDLSSEGKGQGRVTSKQVGLWHSQSAHLAASCLSVCK